MKNNELAIDFSTVLASSVHDMKNSVGMLLASVEAILEEHNPKDEEERKHFGTLHYEASRINGELIQLLTLYRKDNGFLPVHIDEQFVRDVLEDQIARNQTLIETSGIVVELHCDHEFSWYFDADLIGGVIHNVIVNCIRYTRNHIKVAAFERENELVITVEDNGEGYPEDMLASPSKGVREAEVSRGATQLGLYFAEEIAHIHKQGDHRGTITLNNGGALDGGVFSLHLP